MGPFYCPPYPSRPTTFMVGELCFTVKQLQETAFSNEYKKALSPNGILSEMQKLVFRSKLILCQ